MEIPTLGLLSIYYTLVLSTGDRSRRITSDPHTDILRWFSLMA